MGNKNIHWILYSVFWVLIIGYYLQTRTVDLDQQWYILFISRELKTLIVGVTLYLVTAKHTILRKVTLGFLLFQSFELISELIQVPTKGHNYEMLWIFIVGFIIVATPLYSHIKKKL